MNIFRCIACVLLVLLSVGCDTKEEFDKIIFDENGNKYTASYQVGSVYIGKGDSINLLDYNGAELINIFEKECANPIFSTPITPNALQNWEDAAKYGITLLNSCYSEWTVEKDVGVNYNEKENIWIVSGLRRDREHPTLIGIAVFSGGSGELIVMGKI